MNVNDHLNILTILIVHTLVVLSAQSNLFNEERQISDLVRETVNKDYDGNIINYRDNELTSRLDDLIKAKLSKYDSEILALEIKLFEAKENEKRLLKILENNGQNPFNGTYSRHRESKRTGNNLYVLPQAHLNRAQKASGGHLSPADSGRVPFSCPHRTYPNSYVLLCEGRWRDIADTRRK